MLTYLLAWAMAFGSLGLYLTAFFFPELHRKNDLILSGAGLFFALTLFVYAERLRGGLLLGETAAVALILWFGWQSLKYRRELTDPKLKTDDSKAQDLWQAIKSVLPGQKTTEDGIPTNKIAGQISDWVSRVDLEKLKGQFQGVLKKVPLPTASPTVPSATPTPASDNQAPDWDEEPEAAPASETVESPAEVVATEVITTVSEIIPEVADAPLESDTDTTPIPEPEFTPTLSHFSEATNIIESPQAWSEESINSPADVDEPQPEPSEPEPVVAAESFSEEISSEPEHVETIENESEPFEKPTSEAESPASDYEHLEESAEVQVQHSDSDWPPRDHSDIANPSDSQS